jgi:pimeloyl-ACP methyl ester carboxylesterase
MTLAYEETGPVAAPCVVFIHGLIASRWTWRGTTAQLSGYHCLAPDLPGHGESSGLRWKSITDAARQVVELVRAKASGGKANLVGLSLGAMVALQALGEAPDVVSGVIVSGANLLPLPWTVRLLSLVMLPGMRSERFLKASAEGLRLPEEAIPLYRADLERVSRLTVLGASLAASGFRLPKRLEGSSSPVLALAGEQENIRVLDSLYVLLKALPNAQACKIPGARHGWIGEQPALWVNTLGAWLGNEPLPDELIRVQRY